MAPTVNRTSPANPEPAVRLRVFGGLRAERIGSARDRRDIGLGGRQERTLLALLVVHRGQPLPGERLVDLLWPDEPPPTAAKIVQVYIGRLRSAFGSEAIVRTGDAYRLTGLIDVASDAFERLVSAGLDAVNSDPLVALDQLEVALGDADGEPFETETGLLELRAASSRLVERRWQAREARIELLLRLGRTADVLAEVPGLIAADPLRESVRAAGIRALAITGRRAEALAAYQDAARCLRDQLGVEPDAALVDLRARIAGGEPVGPAPIGRPFACVLPQQASTFVGRTAELGDLSERLRPGRARLVTLTGPGGSGKTRLGFETAARLARAFDGAVACVDLAAARDPEQLWPAIRAAIGAEPAAEEMIGGRGLLVLDNPERMDQAGVAVTRLLAGSPHLQVLVTSRVVLQAEGEEVFEIRPLSPDDAAALFAVRAAVAGAPPEPRPVVDAICERLDRLPLAIELAARLARALPGRDLVRALDHRLTTLVGEHPDAPERHRTIEATIAWSHELLAPAEQALFRRLAVFEDGWTVPAAGAVCDASLQDLRTLVDHSLVRRDGERMTMLDTIHEFAADRLAASGERLALLERHAAWYLAEARREQSNASAQDQYRVLGDDVANQRVAMATLCAETPTDRALDLAMLLWMSWIGAGRIAEGDAWFAAATARPSMGEPPPIALTVWGEFARSLGDLDRAEALKLSSVDRLRASGDDRQLAPTLTDLAEIARIRGDLGLARRRAEEALDIRIRSGKPDGVVHALEALAAVEVDEGNLTRAAALLEEGMVYVREVGPMSREAGPFATYVPLDLATVRVRQDDLDAARPLAIEGLQAADRLGLSDAVAFGLEVAAAWLERFGDLEGAALLLGAAAEVRAKVGMVRWSGHEVDRVEGAVVAGLGRELARSLRAEGAAMTRAAVVALAIERMVRRPPS